MAGFDPLKVEAIARLPYALTLWTFLQREEAEYFRSLTREFDRIDEADMIARGFIKGTQPIAQRMQNLLSRVSVPVSKQSREELARQADELWAQHGRAMRSRPVS